MELPRIKNIVVDSFIQVWEDFIKQTPNLLGGLLLILLTWAASRVIVKVIRPILRRAVIRHSLRELILRLVKIAVWITGILLTAMVVFPGLTPAKAIGGLGIASIAIGLAFKDIFENFFAGILILWRFPFEEGDYIECQQIVGKVEAVLIRMTKIRRMTGELVIVPNSFLFKNPVEVLTNYAKRRVELIVSVAYGEDLKNAVKVIESALRHCKSVDASMPVEIFPNEFATSGVNIEVTWWTGSNPQEIRSSIAEIVCEIKQALDDTGIEIPFPYRTLSFPDPVKIEVNSTNT